MRFSENSEEYQNTPLVCPSWPCASEGEGESPLSNGCTP